MVSNRSRKLLAVSALSAGTLLVGVGCSDDTIGPFGNPKGAWYDAGGYDGGLMDAGSDDGPADAGPDASPSDAGTD